MYIANVNNNNYKCIRRDEVQTHEVQKGVSASRYLHHCIMKLKLKMLQWCDYQQIIFVSNDKVRAAYPEIRTTVFLIRCFEISHKFKNICTRACLVEIEPYSL